MAGQETAGREVAKEAGLLAVHLVAVVAGLVFMVAGIAMGVTIVMLPVGVPVGLFGLFAFLWGLFGRSEEKQAAIPPRPQ